MSQGLGSGAVLITGATMGLGKSLANNFLLQGLDLVICARDEKNITHTVHELNKIAGKNQRVIGHPCDVSKVESVRTLKNMTETEGIEISTLICNAGVIGPIGRFSQNNLDSWYEAFQINLNGVVNPVKMFLPNMLQRGIGRIIHISGGGATAPLESMSSYASSKAAAVRFIETLAVEYKDSGVTFNSVAPGIIRSRLLDKMLDAGIELIGKNLFKKAEFRKNSDQDSTVSAIKLINFLSSKSSREINGKLISAEWDNWEEWTNHPSELQNSDVYTLRRITGRDRGKSWGDK